MDKPWAPGGAIDLARPRSVAGCWLLRLLPTTSTVWRARRADPEGLHDGVRPASGLAGAGCGAGSGADLRSVGPVVGGILGGVVGGVVGIGVGIVGGIEELS